ncbi:MAG TPA: YbfB/YjiJ family MFS transporter [Candidatus Baltobacteraceae bacterium]|nr:YbfB/YjiJ family MFS transporter [Candidatus Baltobacteraceae bacterium]
MPVGANVRCTSARFVTSGAIILAVAMGVGRFAYTPLLPVMERDAGLSVAMAGALASANLFGYLVGASLAMHPITHRKRLAIVRWSLAGIVITTALMAGPAPLWLSLRFLTGVGSGFVFVFASSIVLERAARARAPSWPPLFFCGIGLGIAFSGVAVPALIAHGGSRTAWIGMAAISAIVLMTASWFTDDAPATSIVEAGADAALPRHRTIFTWLLAVYTAEAFAYIIPATFLVAVIVRIPALAHYAALAWVFVGLAAAFATFPWIHAAERWGKARALALAFGIQAAGIAAPVFSRSPFAVILAAIALGGTFIAITLFATGLGRDIFPAQTSAAVSRLTALYSVGQIVGPLVATQLALRLHSYDPALLAAAAVAAGATIVTLATIRDPHYSERANVSKKIRSDVS